ncbi:uncharacterized protein VTP21DRAFT_10874 [Calcarisporiella thermophila]|uniref:uncharacterized protein n=1 Tax=Calcarisporiella thermophila TaxID=911321 RepID=UPI0037421573
MEDSEHITQDPAHTQDSEQNTIETNSTNEDHAQQTQGSDDNEARSLNPVPSVPPAPFGQGEGSLHAFAPPPVFTLPPGWTQHQSPTGHPYFYNSITGQSSWVPPPPQPLAYPPPQMAPSPIPKQPTEKSPKKKAPKDKAKSMRPIPGTSWRLVTTHQGNEFYHNKETGKSSWVLPEEIREAVDKMKQEDKEREREEEEKKKRKAEEEELEAKRVKRENQEDMEITEDDFAYQLQFMDEETRRELGIEAEQSQETTEEEKRPERTSGILSEEERKEAFRQLLLESDINPFGTWEKELSKFIHDSRYTLVEKIKDRKDIFDMVCRKLIQERKSQKIDKPKSGRDQYLQLLAEETTHRTYWDDFSRRFRRDKRFTALDSAKERETLFKDHVAKLREKRKMEMKKARDDFLELLKETSEIGPNSSWRKIKQIICDDPRYEAVGSSTEREDIFYDYCRQLEDEEREERRRERERRAKEEASLRERERVVRAQKHRQLREMDNQKSAAIREEAVGQFRSLLVDFVRSHQLTWSEKRADLERDPRFHPSTLTEDERKRLFAEHTDEIYRKRVKQYQTLLDAYPLNAEWLEIRDAVREDPRTTRLTKEEKLLEELFDQYQRERQQRAIEEFLELLNESHFLEFRKKPVLDYNEIIDVLKEDKRYHALDHVPEERDKLVRNHIKKVEDRASKIKSVHVNH